MELGRSERFHALDTVRGAALLLGIFFHATLAYLPSSEQVWIVEDASRSAVMSALYFVSHNFRMTTFFLIAGFFGRMSYHRLGGGTFLKDRFKRLGIPFVVGWIIIFPTLIGLILWGLAVQNGGTLPDLPPPPPPTWKTVDLTYLWFLYVLLLFYPVMLLLRTVVAIVDRGGRLRQAGDAILAKLFKTPLIVVVLAVPSALALAGDANLWMWFGLPTPNFGLIPALPAAAAYGTAFVFGWVLHRQPEVLFSLERNGSSI